MVRLGLRVRGLWRTNSRMRRQMTVLRQVVGQDHKLVLEHRDKEKNLSKDLNKLNQDHHKMLENSVDALKSWGSRALEAERRLERVPRWVRWLFKAL